MRNLTPAEFIDQDPDRTQASTARELEISQPHMSDLLSGKRRWTYALACRLQVISEGAVLADSLVDLPEGFALVQVEQGEAERVQP